MVIGSRGSPLALWQARHVSQLLNQIGIDTRIEIIKTTGDHLQTASLVQAGGKGLFTKEIEDALLAGSIDLAVHSLKDLPTETPAGLAIAAIPEREDPRDALVGRTLAALHEGALVGTSSGRRAAQMGVLRPDLRIEPVRGNVDTRLRKLHEGQFDSILLAAAGLHRLSLESQIAEYLTIDRMCPAAGQGALAIQTRAGDKSWRIAQQLDHAPSRLAVACERSLLAELGGGCQLPVGAFAQLTHGRLHLTATVTAPDASLHLRISGEDAPEKAIELGARLAAELSGQGAHEILAQAS